MKKTKLFSSQKVGRGLDSAPGEKTKIIESRVIIVNCCAPGGRGEKTRAIEPETCTTTSIRQAAEKSTTRARQNYKKKEPERKPDKAKSREDGEKADPVVQNDPDHKKPKEIAEEVKILTDLPAAERRETMTADG